MSNNIKGLKRDRAYSYIALGSFDGLHVGHLTLVEKIIELSKINGGESIVYTFKNHPRTLIKSHNPLKLLLDNHTKIEILDEIGVDKIYFEEFNEEFMKYSPEEFIRYLCEKFNVRGIVVGFNYRFGYKNMGDVNLLRELSDKYGYDLYVIDPCTYNEEIVSSTRIRNDLMDGNVEEASIMLTRPYSISGEVIHGKKNGRLMGFPTANLNYSEEFVLPKIGVYYTNIRWNNKIYKGITSVGKNPTFNGKDITIETNILDFDREIYGDEITVYFISKLRNEQKFSSIDDLKNQLDKDKKEAEKEKIFVK